MLRDPRTYSGRRPGGENGRRHRRLSTDGHGRAALAACSGLTCAAESSVHPRVPARRPGGSPRAGWRGGWCADEPGGGSGGRDAGRASGAGAGRPAVRGRGARPGAPVRDIAILLVSELFGNSVQHSGSGAPGETVTVADRTGDGVVRVEVTDRMWAWRAGVAPRRSWRGRRPGGSGLLT